MALPLSKMTSLKGRPNFKGEPAEKTGTRIWANELKWAFSIVKTRGFAFDLSRNSTMLIPLADFLNHHPQPNVRTPGPSDRERSAADVLGRSLWA